MLLAHCWNNWLKAKVPQSRTVKMHVVKINVSLSIAIVLQYISKSIVGPTTTTICTDTRLKSGPWVFLFINFLLFLSAFSVQSQQCWGFVALPRGVQPNITTLTRAQHGQREGIRPRSALKNTLIMSGILAACVWSWLSIPRGISVDPATSGTKHRQTQRSLTGSLLRPLKWFKTCYKEVCVYQKKLE